MESKVEKVVSFALDVDVQVVNRAFDFFDFVNVILIIVGENEFAKNGYSTITNLRNKQ